eukprot:9442936-Pyramimonas_sp.AAC.1
MGGGGAEQIRATDGGRGADQEHGADDFAAGSRSRDDGGQGLEDEVGAAAKGPLETEVAQAAALSDGQGLGGEDGAA